MNIASVNMWVWVIFDVCQDRYIGVVVCERHAHVGQMGNVAPIEVAPLCGEGTCLLCVREAVKEMK